MHRLVERFRRRLPPGRGVRAGTPVELHSVPWLLDHREWTLQISMQLLNQRGDPKDKPLNALYRLYEAIVRSWVTEYRNEIENFWNQHGWPVASIPDQRDPDPVRYAILAAIPYLLVRAFNRNISLGLPRDAPAVIIDFEELERRPKVLEEVPSWCQHVAPLAQILSIPDEQGTTLSTSDDPEACPEFRDKNIVIREPHIYFV